MRAVRRWPQGSGLLTSPFRVPVLAWAVFPVFVVAAASVAISSRLFEPRLLESELAFAVPFILLVFPCLLEEAFFRGLLIPRNARDHGVTHAIGYTALSTTLFVAWHPLNATVMESSATPLFWKPAFLFIVALLGLSCSIAYIVSRSLWVPILIHWATVVVWVFFLGGGNLILKL